MLHAPLLKSTEAGHVWLAAKCVGDARFGHLRRTSAGGMDMCLVKIDAAGKPLWVSGLGGSKTDRAYGVVAAAGGRHRARRPRARG
ncbi:MAG: hypothetical protein ACKO35_02935 [Planctomycetaceae bacterium]